MLNKIVAHDPTEPRMLPEDEQDPFIEAQKAKLLRELNMENRELNMEKALGAEKINKFLKIDHDGKEIFAVSYQKDRLTFVNLLIEKNGKFSIYNEGSNKGNPVEDELGVMLGHDLRIENKVIVFNRDEIKLKV